MSRGAEGSDHPRGRSSHDPQDRSPEPAGAELLPLLDELHVALIATDLDNRIIAWEGAAERIFGFTAAEAIGRRSEELPIATERIAARMRHALFSSPESPVEHDLQLRRRGGVSFPARVRFGIRFGPDGSVAGSTVVISDSSTARRADRELPTVFSVGPLASAAGMALAGSDRRELLEQIIDLLVFGMGVDLAAVIVAGAEPGEVVLEAGYGWERIEDGAALELVDAEVPHVFPRGRAGVREIRAAEVPAGGLLAAEGAADGLAAPIGDPEHPVGSVVVFCTSPRVFSQQEIEFVRSLGYVLTTADEHTRIRELEARFHRASRMEAMGQLTGGIAHDFNNLLAVILNYAGFAREEASASGGQGPGASIAEIEAAARRAAELTQQLLVFSRQEVVAVEPIDVAEAVAGAEGLLAVTLGESIELRTELVRGLRPIEAGRGQIEQILVNLAANARDAMPAGGTFEVTVGAAGEGDGYERIELLVRDSGVGMSREVLEKAFEPFFTTKPVGEGSGFGLATVYGIVSGLGGTIELRSELGEGTTVDIKLPAMGDDAAAPATRESSPVAAPPPGRRVLLVEDDDMVRRLTERVLTGGGYEVVACGEADAAMRFVVDDDEGFGVLLTDVVMPETTGVELALQVRERVPGIRVVFMSGYTGDSVPREAVREIEAGFVEKPFTPETLLACVGEAFAQP